MPRRVWMYSSSGVLAADIGGLAQISELGVAVCSTITRISHRSSLGFESQLRSFDRLIVTALRANRADGFPMSRLKRSGGQRRHENVGFTERFFGGKKCRGAEMSFQRARDVPSEV